MTITKTALSARTDWPEEKIVNFGYQVGYGTVALDNTYISGGWTLAPSSVNANLSTIKSYSIQPVAGYQIVWDHANSLLKCYKEGWAKGAYTATIGHDADAATKGKALYVVPEPGGFYASLNADMSSTGTDEDFAMGNGGPQVWVEDNNASPTGVVVYCDEDGAYGSRLLCVSPTGADLHVPLSDGGFLVIKHSAGAAGVGVQVYFDDDAANNYAVKCLFVSPTTTAASVVLPTMPIDALNGVTVYIRAEGY